jgi:hypothetical protein
MRSGRPLASLRELATLGAFLEALAALFRPHAGVRHLGQVCEICSYWYAP